MTGAAPRWELGISLPGDWNRVDLADPAPPGVPDEVVQALRDLGLMDLDAAREVRLAATLVDPGSEDYDGPPLVAGMVVLSTDADRPTAFERTPQGQVVPHRKVARARLEWPDGVGRVVLHHVSYTLPAPSGPQVFVLEFTTPNLPFAAELETVFDAAVSTVRFAQRTAAG
ncbi:hypothetical protein [Kineosporia sp. A_224]|uniref:hypothetical protein n=1 Tax=Kineosporia sp. A_224 TaxID=1962180 RepID=UPI00117AFE2C|nr:hypothetical protein [Kineosporia sp. A_224]